MDGNKATLSSLPDPLQELLLTACLADGEEARKAWESWLSQVDMNHLDFGSSKLLPLLYRNLRALGVDHPVIDRLKGVYRATWFRNQMLLREASGLVALFRSIGVDSMILKGAALIHTVYGDIGARAMEDVDLLVPTSRSKEVLALLLAQGWTPKPWLPRAMTGPYFAIKHGFNFRYRTGQLIDLHWHAMDECIGPGVDDDFWAASRPLEIHGQPAWTLCPSDHLLHTIVHGMKWNPIAPLRWVADAFSLIRKEEMEMDWLRLVEQAERRNLVLPVKAGLRYLVLRMGAPVPPSVLDDLDRSTVDPLEYVAFSAQTYAPSELGLLWRVRRQHARYRRITADAGFRTRMIRLVQFLEVGFLELFRDHLFPGLKHFRRKDCGGCGR